MRKSRAAGDTFGACPEEDFLVLLPKGHKKVALGLSWIPAFAGMTRRVVSASKKEWIPVGVYTERSECAGMTRPRSGYSASTTVLFLMAMNLALGRVLVLPMAIGPDTPGAVISTVAKASRSSWRVAGFLAKACSMILAPS